MASKLTQWDRIYRYLKSRKKATNMELVTALWIACPHKRIAEQTHANGMVAGTMGRERIGREFIKTKGGARVVQYRLERT